MNQCCFICNNSAKVSLRNSVSIFGEYNTLQSGRKLSEVLSDVVEKPVEVNQVHANILCKKCFNACSEFDAVQLRLSNLKKELIEQFKLSLPCHLLKYENYEKNFQKPTPKPITIPAKKLVLPASKLQPIPPALLLKVGKLAQFSSALNAAKSTSTPTVNVQLTNSIFPQSIKPEVPTSANNTIQTSVSNTKSLETKYFNTFPKDFLSGAVITKIEDKNIEIIDDEDNMEIDKDCSSMSVVPVSTGDGNNVVLPVSLIKSNNVSEFLSSDLPNLSDSEDTQNFVLGNVQIVNEGDEDDDTDEHTIVVDSDNTASILRMVSGQKIVYEGGEISLVMPGDESQHEDQQDNGDSQDSNDESQIELQVSGDEETANAIIAAAQEQGGAFIKVESGEMFRVQSVHSAPDPGLHMVRKDGANFVCLLCHDNDITGESSTVMTTAEQMMKHLRVTHSAKTYICQFCGAVMRKRNDYVTHIAEHAQKLKPSGRQPPLRCDVCGKTYNSRTLLAEHANIHTGHRPYVCQLCNKTFASKYTHQAHMKTHSVRPRPFKCNECGKSFLTQQNLNQHEKTHTGVKDFVCKVCGKAFSTQHNLEFHGVVHSGYKSFVCSVCHKAFARRAELRDHARIHTGERPFSCDVCGARFTQRSNLHSHRRATHLDDKRHLCQLCPKRFKRRRLLEYHIKASHTGERPLKCPMCPSSFVYPEHYKKHIRIHSGERPYVCEICGKSFNSRDNRNTHRFVHSDKKPYECVTCGLGFMRKQLLYAHMNTSGHLAESIVINQPRVVKVTENDGTQEAIQDSNDRFGQLFETSELDTNDDKDGDKTTLNLIQDADEPTLLTIHNLDERNMSSILDSVDVDQTEIVANDENGGMVRLVQIKLPDGNNGWVALNR